jgi:hypothetical protein
MFSPKSAWICLLAVAVSGPLAAQTGPTPGDDEPVDPVRVYTNADLERFGPPSVDAEPAAADDDPGWEFVTEFLAREHERLDAQRSYDLERRRTDLAEEAAERRRARPVYFYPYYGHRFVHVGRHPRGRRVGHYGTTTVGGPIVPLHARPTLAEVQRAKAIRRSGVDAFPDR